MGIGLPSTAANLARRLYSPAPVLVYESGCIGCKPTRLPLSIGDGELAETADAVVSVPEIFAYWLQAGRIDVGFLGGAQLDRFANINSTVIGDYEAPPTRLPGAGGAPEIAASAGQVMVIMRQSSRAFVERCDFRSSMGFGDGPGDRERSVCAGPVRTLVITDLGILRPDPRRASWSLTRAASRCHPRAVHGSTGWPLRFADDVGREAVGRPQLEMRRLRELAGRVTTMRLRLRGPAPAAVLFGPARATLADEVRRLGVDARVRHRRRPRRGIADELAGTGDGFVAAALARGRAARSGRARRTRSGGDHRRRRRWRRDHRRRLVHRTRQGDRACRTVCPSSPCRRPTPAASRPRSTASPAGATSRPGKTPSCCPAR